MRKIHRIELNVTSPQNVTNVGRLEFSVRENKMASDAFGLEILEPFLWSRKLLPSDLVAA